MTAFAPVRDAYRLWLQTSLQLTLEVDDLTSLPVSDHSPGGARTNGFGASAPGRTTPTTKALARSTYPGSASEGSQETS